MSKMKREPTDSQGQILPPSERLEPWEQLLDETAKMYSKQLTAEEVQAWGKFLQTEPAAALREAFGNWQRNGRFFPKPKDILDLVAVYKVEKRVKFIPCGECADGWVYVTAGKTVGGNEVSENAPAVKRCECFKQWAEGKAA